MAICSCALRLRAARCRPSPLAQWAKYPERFLGLRSRAPDCLPTGRPPAFRRANPALTRSLRLALSICATQPAKLTRTSAMPSSDSQGSWTLTTAPRGGLTKASDQRQGLLSAAARQPVQAPNDQDLERAPVCVCQRLLDGRPVACPATVPRGFVHAELAHNFQPVRLGKLPDRWRLIAGVLLARTNSHP